MVQKEQQQYGTDKCTQIKRNRKVLTVRDKYLWYMQNKKSVKSKDHNDYILKIHRKIAQK